MMGVSTVLIFLDNDIAVPPLDAVDAEDTRSLTIGIEANEVKAQSSTAFTIQSAKPDDISTVKCGNLKCFITFESSNEKTNNVGYIVAQDNRTELGEGFESKLDEAWAIASNIHHRYNLSTLLLGPSETISKDAQFVETLNDKLVHHSSPTRKIQGFNPNTPLIVQKSLVMPDPHYFWHYQVSVVTKKLLNMDSVYTNFIQTNVKDIDHFIETLQKDVNATKDMLMDNDYPCLLNDFQLVIDFQGHIHHIDLDRCFDVHQKQLSKDMMIRFIDTLGKRYTSNSQKLLSQQR